MAFAAGSATAARAGDVLCNGGVPHRHRGSRDPSTVAEPAVVQTTETAATTSAALLSAEAGLNLVAARATAATPAAPVAADRGAIDCQLPPVQQAAPVAVATDTPEPSSTVD